MAISTLRKLAFQVIKTPSFSLSSRAIITRSSASASASAKVADRNVKLFAIDPNGNKREVVGLSGQTLLRVHIAQEWLENLPPASYDEQYVLKRNSRNRLQGMMVAVPERKPWDIP
ncbi:hypothetical protein Pfo_006795 [Paulownia fortunei]|nr:hypothetical protein Pfo_006795 [Paulownia fortunei]